MAAPRKEPEGEWGFRATQAALCFAQQHRTLQGAQGKPGAAMVALVVRRALPAGHPLPWGRPGSVPRLLSAVHPYPQLHQSHNEGTSKGSPEAALARKPHPPHSTGGGSPCPHSTKRTAGPEAPAKCLLGCFFFFHSWEQTVSFCWRTDCSFHVKRLVQYVSS